MLAAGLSLLLLLAPAGTPPTRAPPPRRAAAVRPLSPENTDRAKRGLLPRKAVRANRSKRSVVRASAPVWLPAPSVADPEVLIAGADLDSTGKPVVYPRFEAAIHGVEVRWMVIRHRPR